MRRRCLTVCAALLLSVTAVSAQPTTVSWNCESGDLRRVVELNEGLADTPICEVWYDKTMEGGAKTRLWSADNDPNFCRPQAEALVAKLSGWGWTCAIVAPVE